MTRKVLITGGAGFIGTNLALRLLRDGAQVRILDSLARAGVEHNLRSLQQEFPSLEFVRGDVRDRALVESIARDVSEIYHLAAQVAVTTSVDDPRADLETNLLGAFNVLEAARRSPLKPFFLYTSTNKVYGDLAHVPIVEDEDAYRFRDRAALDESEALDFHSPYGCSKGAAEQYVRDYARIYGLPAVVFRMSCIAGPFQYGHEDQGWLAHFIYSIADREPITIYGSGKQVRDVLHVADLIDAFCLAERNRTRTVGQIFNLGGGPQSAVSLRQVIPMIEQAVGSRAKLSGERARVGDQRIFVTDHAKFTQATGWQPQRDVPTTIADIVRWRQENRQHFASAAAMREATA